MADEFEAAHERGEDDIPRDRYGRYLLPHPETGKRQAWTRSTTFAKSISDTFALSQWSQRMVVKGLTERRDLLSLAHNLDVKKDKDKLNQIAEDAKSAAGNKVAANLGTALHSFSEALDRGDMGVEDVPEEHRDDIAAYATAMRTAGVRVVPGMIECQVALPPFEVGGTFDRILDLDGVEPWFRSALADAGYTVDPGDVQEVIGDVKSGQDLQYGWNEIAIQLAIYALAARNFGVWDRKTQTWLPPRPVRLDFAIVMHMPVGQGVCTLWALDLREAMDAMELCRAVRRWRKVRKLATPLERVVAEPEYRTCPCGGTDPGGHVDGCPNDTGYVCSQEPHPGREFYGDGGCGECGYKPPAVAVHAGLSWLQRFQSAGSRGELSALFKEAHGAGVWCEELRAAGVARLAVLEEKAG